jgi:hypothetical protein
MISANVEATFYIGLRLNAAVELEISAINLSDAACACGWSQQRSTFHSIACFEAPLPWLPAVIGFQGWRPERWPCGLVLLKFCHRQPAANETPADCKLSRQTLSHYWGRL